MRVLLHWHTLQPTALQHIFSQFPTSGIGITLVPNRPIGIGFKNPENQQIQVSIDLIPIFRIGLSLPEPRYRHCPSRFGASPKVEPSRFYPWPSLVSMRKVETNPFRTAVILTVFVIAFSPYIHSLALHWPLAIAVTPAMTAIHPLLCYGMNRLISFSRLTYVLLHQIS